MSTPTSDSSLPGVVGPFRDNFRMFADPKSTKGEQDMRSRSICAGLALISLAISLPAYADPVTFGLNRVTTNGPDLRPQITLTAQAMPGNTVMFHVNNLAGG